MFIVGDSVFLKGIPGVIRFKGETQFASGLWFGVELEEPLGKNNGSVDDIVYFNCEPKYGLFVRESSLENKFSRRRRSSLGVSQRVTSLSRRSSSRVSDGVDISRRSSSRFSHRIDSRRSSSHFSERTDSRRGSSRLSDRLEETSKERLALDNASKKEIKPHVEPIKTSSVKERVETLEAKPISSPETLSQEPITPHAQELTNPISLPSSSNSTSVTSPNENSEAKLKAIIQKLQDKLRVIHVEIDSLKQQILLLSKHNSAIQEHKDKIEEDIEVLTIDKETLEEQNELMRNEIQSLKEVNEDLNKQLEDLREEIIISREIDSEDTIESIDSLRSRIFLLEKALLKLKNTYTTETESLRSQVRELTNDLNSKGDYRELKTKLDESEILIKELQEHVESSIQSTEMIEKLTNQNYDLSEENKKLTVTLQDLEDLRKVEQDLEKLHIETEFELQEQIKSLETSLTEKITLIEQLEVQNKELTLKIPSDSKLSFNDLKLLNDLKVKNENIQRDKRNLQLQLDLTNIEFNTFKEFSDSSTPTKRQFLTISRKLSKIAEYIKLDNDDIYLDLLALLKKHELSQKSIQYERYSHVEFKYHFNDLEELVEQIVHNVKEQEFNRFLNLNDVKIEFTHFYEFKNRDEIIASVKSQLTSIDTIKSLVNYLSKFVINDGFNKVFQLAQDYQNDLIVAEEELSKQIEQGNETSKVEVNSLCGDTELLINDLINLTKAPDFKKSQLLTFQPSNIIHALEIKPKYITYESKHVDKSEQSSKLTKQSSIDLQKFETQANTQAIKIEELEVKIGVLNSRLIHSKETESLMKKYKSNYEKLSKENESLNQELSELIASNKKLTTALHKAKNLSLLNNSEFDSLLEQREHFEKTQLISEIHLLRNAIRFKPLNKKNYNWLRKSFPKHIPFQPSEVDELRRIGRDLRKAVERSIVI